MTETQSKLSEEIDTLKRDNSKLVNQCEVYSEYYAKIKAELEKVMLSLECKTKECNEWKQKYEESDKQLASTVASMEDFQKESFVKSQKLTSIKEEELKKIETALKSQFGQEAQKYNELIQKLQKDLENSKGQNKEVTNEMIKITNENSSLTLRLKKLEKEIHVNFIFVIYLFLGA